MKIIEAYKPRPIPIKGAELISVVVAVYNIESYVERCIRSIMCQTYSNLQIILVDDGSTDTSGSICDRMAAEDARIQVIHKKNGGLSDARNKGMDAARGIYLAFVDGDDWIDAVMYEKMLAAMLEYEADFAACRYRCIYRDRTVDATTGRLIIFEGRQALASYIAEEEQYPIQNAAWNKLYRRELVENQKFPLGKWYEDIVYTTKLLSKIKRCAFVDEALYNYVLDREGSIMSAGINVKVLTDQIPAYFEKTAFLKSIGEDELASIHNYYIYKRLLIMYTQFEHDKDKNRKTYCKELEAIIKKERGSFAEAYSCKGANPNEKKKMDIFLKSPLLYRWVINFNNMFILPIKRKRHFK